MRRKLLCVTIAYISGLSAAYLWDSRLILILPLMLLFFCRKRKLEAAVIVFFILGCISMLSENYFIEKDIQRVQAHTGHTVTGRVTEVRKEDKDFFKITCEVSGSRILCTYYHNIDDYWSLIGNDITFVAEREIPRTAGNPRTFDYNLYLRTEKIYHTSIVDEFTLTENEKNLLEQLKSFIIEKREKFLSSLNTGEEETSLLRGVLFGDTASMNEDAYKDFQSNGTAHVMAVSGLHIGILYGVYRRIRRKNKSHVITAIFVAVMLIYGTATLWPVSVMRASGLILLMIFSDFTNRKYDMITALASVSMAVALFNPYAVMGAGFQMSFLAVLSMAFFTPVLKRIGVKGYIGSVLAAQLGLTPYIMYIFNFFAPLSILCNFPVIWIVSVLVPLGIVGFMVFASVGIIFPPLCECLTALSRLTVWINEVMAAAGKFSSDIISPPIGIVILFYGLFFFLSSEFFAVYIRRKDYRKLMPLLLLVFLAAGIISYSGRNQFDNAQLVFLDVGQGDSLHVKDGGDRDVLIDGGGSINYNVGEKTLKPYLLKNGVKNIDLAAVTHLHTDHFLGIEQLADCFDVKQVLTQGRSGDVINLSESCKIEILWPEKQDANTEDENLNSLVFKLYKDGVTVIMTGDITEDGERMLIKKYKDTDKLKADILKVAHHGSRYSTCDEFIQAVRPSVAIISVGKNNYGHPSNEIIEKLQKRGIMVFRTDKKGAVGIICSKGDFSICTNRP